LSLGKEISGFIGALGEGEDFRQLSLIADKQPHAVGRAEEAIVDFYPSLRHRGEKNFLSGKHVPTLAYGFAASSAAPSVDDLSEAELVVQ
jgi:hypothetical protein